MDKKRVWYWICVGVFCAVFFTQAHAQNLGSLRFSDSKGVTHSLKDFEGKVVLLNLWATWCKPCLEEMPALNRLQQAVRESGVEVITLNTNVSDPELIERFFQKNNMHALTVYYDPSETALQLLDVNAIPASFVINARGQMVKRIDGPREWDGQTIQNYLMSLR